MGTFLLAFLGGALVTACVLAFLFWILDQRPGITKAQHKV